MDDKVDLLGVGAGKRVRPEGSYGDQVRHLPVSNRHSNSVNYRKNLEERDAACKAAGNSGPMCLRLPDEGVVE